MKIHFLVGLQEIELNTFLTFAVDFIIRLIFNT